MITSYTYACNAASVIDVMAFLDELLQEDVIITHFTVHPQAKSNEHMLEFGLTKQADSKIRAILESQPTAYVMLNSMRLTVCDTSTVHVS